jgi:putative membrane protein insertion efficiency factor
MMARLLSWLVRAYQLLFGWLPASCRFHPSCSAYAIEALQTHGAVGGAYLAAARIVRCGPWCQGGDDPVPATGPSLFTSRIDPSKKNS